MTVKAVWLGKPEGKRVSFDMERDPGERDAHVGDRAVRGEVAQLHLRLVQDRAEGAAARRRAVQVVQLACTVELEECSQRELPSATRLVGGLNQLLGSERGRLGQALLNRMDF